MQPPRNHLHLLHPDNTLLVVIDMQEPFLGAIFERERLIKNVTTLMRGMNVLRIPVVTTTQYAKRMGGVIPEIRQCLPPLVTPFDKMSFSCMASPAFASEIQRSGRKQIVLCGVESHICVSQTAHDLIAAGFQVHLAVDAISSRTEVNYRVGVDKMRQGGVILGTVESVLYELLYEAGTPEFREVLSLVK
ncbi:MAG: isochorismatase family protein [Chloroherpetonaceae bacterium]|nr:isochorismatase family protein [Chthonomonadaceae bacterium]MDW8207164.1 isochorismatase family protein [Chloroherpetonaceae bacterium]